VDESTILAVAGAGIVLILGYLAMSGGSGANEKRKNAIVNSGRPEKAGLFSFLKSEDNSNRRKQIEASLGDLEMRTKNKEKARKTLKSKLIQADWSMTAQTFTIISVILGVLAAAGAFFAKVPLFVVGGIGVVVGFGLPRWFLGMVVTRRQKKFTEHFSDAMDIIVRGVRTGLPLGDCLKIIAHESPEPVQTEFRLDDYRRLAAGRYGARDHDGTGLHDRALYDENRSQKSDDRRGDDGLRNIGHAQND